MVWVECELDIQTACVFIPSQGFVFEKDLGLGGVLERLFQSGQALLYQVQLLTDDLGQFGCFVGRVVYALLDFLAKGLEFFLQLIGG